MNKGIFPHTLAQQKNHLKSIKIDKQNLQLAIVLKIKQPILIGSIGLHNIDWTHRTGDISILIGEQEGRGKGIGRKAINILVNHAFKKMNLRKLTAGMWAKNIASKKSFEANGFILEGTRREQYFSDGEYLDSFEYGLLKNDWLKDNN
tara:strand:- start:235 stop:678 length:444 start_codon:yes stop_codon:yes gene_type:complete